MDQEQLMTELVKDIANELDNRLLYHKILQNLCKLTSADRASLYLVEGMHGFLKEINNKTATSKVGAIFEAQKPQFLNL